MKTLAGMKWASNNLKDEDFYSSGDDDMIVNLGLLQENIDKYATEKSNNQWPEYPLICSYGIRIGGTPKRSRSSKNRITIEEYKWTEWPKFCFGGMYTTSVSVIKQLYEISKTRAPLRTDDVWITGILRNIMGMPSSMIVFPEPAIAQHTSVYGHNNKPKVATKNFLKVWENTYQNFSSKSICKC